MKRRDFLKVIGIGLPAAILSGEIVKAITPEPKSYTYVYRFVNHGVERDFTEESNRNARLDAFARELADRAKLTCEMIDANHFDAGTQA